MNVVTQGDLELNVSKDYITISHLKARAASEKLGMFPETLVLKTDDLGDLIKGLVNCEKLIMKKQGFILPEDLGGL